MEKRTTLGLLIAFAVLVAAAWWLNRPQESPTPESGTISPTIAPLWSLDQATISEIRIEDTKSKTFVDLQKDKDGKWILAGLPPREADQNVITAALAQLATVFPSNDFGEDLNPSDFGLDKNFYLFTIKTSDNKSYYVEVARDTTPTGNNYYVRFQGTKRIYTIGSGIMKPIVDFLTTPPLPTTPTPTATVTLPATSIPTTIVSVTPQGSVSTGTTQPQPTGTTTGTSSPASTPTPGATATKTAVPSKGTVISTP